MKLICATTLILASLICSAQSAGKRKTFSPTPSQAGFATPQLAAESLVKAVTDDDQTALTKMFGTNSEDILSTGDPVQDKSRIATFLAKANERQAFENRKNEATLLVGFDEWPLPIPIVKHKGMWYFDAKAGREEMLRRRIGSNELDAITICRGYVEAQKQYALQYHDGVNQYAQKIISTPGQQDGLYWQNADGTHGGPISEAIARAIAEGYSTEKRTPYHGYYFKILKGQGPAAPLGELDFVINGVMIGGFALIAAPAEYGVTGIKTFMVSHEGIVYQKDFGPDTLKTVAQIDRYNPDKTWVRTDDQWPGAEVASSTDPQ